jgi:hypothetical protein
VIPPKNTAVICIGKTLPKKWLAGDTQLLMVSDKFSAEIVCNEVQKIFNRFDAIERALLRELGEDQDFDIMQILRLCTEAMENPLAVVDSSLKDMLSSTIDKQHDNKLLIEVSDAPFDLTVETATKIKDVCKSEYQILEPFISSLTVQGFRAYNYNFYQMGYFIGFAYFRESCRPFRESDYPIANYFFPYIKDAYLRHLRHKMAKESPEVTVLQKLLEHNALSAEEHNQLKLAPNELWTCFTIIEKRGERSMTTDYMCTTINALLKGMAYAVNMGDDSIAGLLRIRQEESHEETALAMFGNLTKQMGYRGGFSDKFTDINKLDKHLLQAEHATNMHNQIEADATILSFQDYILDYFLQAGIEMLPLEMLYSKGLRTLLDYDRRKNTDYARTLEAWLRNEMSLTQTANEVFIQRSSLVKRLDKIKRLTGDDFSDPDTRLYYRICFRLMKN